MIEEKEIMDKFMDIVKNHAKSCEECNKKLLEIISHAFDEMFEEVEK